MTTRAGLAGLLTGLAVALLLHVGLRPAWPGAGCPWIAAAAAALLLLAGGGRWAARRSGSVRPARCAALGALSGGLAGALAFCLFGAAFAATPAAGPAAVFSPPVGLAARLMRTETAFLVLFLAGSGAGALGGWLAHPRPGAPADVFDKQAPQMALNGAITAVPASVVAAALAAGVFLRLGDLVGQQTGESGLPARLAGPPLGLALLLVLLSQLVLLLVIPHEARQADHRCGMDEIKMAAYVAIGAAPLLGLLLFLLARPLFWRPPVMAALLASLALSLQGLHTLRRVVLPRRAAFPAPPPGRQQTQARFFGTIAHSRGPRLVVLCAGCGLLMVLPVYVTVLAPLVNLAAAGRPFLLQALAGLGPAAAAGAALTAIYLFYLHLGRRFARHNPPPGG